MNPFAHEAVAFEIIPPQQPPLEREVVLGPLDATLTWLPRSAKPDPSGRTDPYAHTYARVLHVGRNVGGVYIAYLTPAARSGPSGAASGAPSRVFLKVGM